MPQRNQTASQSSRNVLFVITLMLSSVVFIDHDDKQNWPLTKLINFCLSNSDENLRICIKMLKERCRGHQRLAEFRNETKIVPKYE